MNIFGLSTIMNLIWKLASWGVNFPKSN